MKKLFLLSIFLGINAFAQNKKIPNGDYAPKNDKNNSITLNIQDDKFKMTYLSGTYEVVNDSIFFHSENENDPIFNLKFLNESPSSNKLTLTLDAKSLYNSYDKYIGIQENSSSEVNYKSFEDFFGVNTSSYSIDKDFSVDVDKTAFIYLVQENEKSSNIEKYAIPNTVSQVNISVVFNALKSFKLKAHFDDAKKSLIITEGRNPISFYQKSEIKQEDKILPIEKSEQKQFTFTGKKASIYDQTEVTDSTAVVNDGDYKPPYNFKHTKFHSIDEALKSVAASNSKILVISIDKNKDAQSSFDTFIKDSETTLTDYMYDGYDAERDHFNFYLASEKDKKNLSKYKITDNPTLLFFNKNNELIYHTKGTLSSNSDKITNNSSFYNELEKTNQKVEIDKKFKNKKLEINEIKTVFKNVAKYKSSNNYDDDEVAVETVDSAVTEVKFAASRAVESAAASAARAATAVVDTTAMVVDSAATPYYGYERYNIEDKENLYKLKTSKAVILEKWNQLVDYYVKNDTFDEDYVSIIKSDFKRCGLVNQLFEENKRTISDADFKMLDYIFKNYNQININEKENSSNEDGFPLDKIDTAINRFFAKSWAQYLDKKSNYFNKLKEYNTKYLKISNYNFESVQGYYEALRANNLSKEFIPIYDDYFTNFTSNGKSFIENLDQHYTEENSDQDWNSYKETFSSIANNTAWSVVENNDTSMVKKALQWSELSLKLSPNNHYHLDTLAQLYYKNGEKAKAIMFEQKAIEVGAKDSDYNVDEYKEVLERMKNGTY